MKVDLMSIEYYNNINNLLSPEVLRQIVMKYIDLFPNVTSCASSVIDTKIEQAMDMVKTHLMSSMRAEVESLKARIAELMERIHQLEVENDFLKANASPEVLHALRSGVAQQGRVQDASLQNNNFVISSPTQSAAI